MAKPREIRADYDRDTIVIYQAARLVPREAVYPLPPALRQPIGASP